MQHKNILQEHMCVYFIVLLNKPIYYAQSRHPIHVCGLYIPTRRSFMSVSEAGCPAIETERAMSWQAPRNIFNILRFCRLAPSLSLILRTRSYALYARLVQEVIFGAIPASITPSKSEGRRKNDAATADPFPLKILISSCASLSTYLREGRGGPPSQVPVSVRRQKYDKTRQSVTQYRPFKVEGSY